MDTYKTFVQSTLEGLVKELHGVVHAYCDEEHLQISRTPRFYLMSKRLALSQKVNPLCNNCTCSTCCHLIVCLHFRLYKLEYCNSSFN